MVNFWASFIYPIVLMFLWLYFYLFIYLYLCLIFHVILRYISQYCFRLCSSSFSFRSIYCLETIFCSIVFSHLWLFPLNYWSNHDYSLVMLCYVLFLLFFVLGILLSLSITIYIPFGNKIIMYYTINCANNVNVKWFPHYIYCVWEMKTIFFHIMNISRQWILTFELIEWIEM